MAAISGKDGTASFSGISVEVRGWSVNIKSNAAQYASSSTDGWKKAVGTIKEWEATVTLYAADGEAAYVASIGSEATLTLTTDGTNSLSGTAILDDIGQEVDIEDGELVGIECKFIGSGALT